MSKEADRVAEVRQQEAAVLWDELEKSGVVPDDVDELVHEVHANKAAQVNNEFSPQIRLFYLMCMGMTAEEIKGRLNDIMG